MPIKQAAMKALRQTKKRTLRRTTAKKELKLLLHKIKKLLDEKKKSEAQGLAVGLQKMLDKAAKGRIIAKNKANRLKSRLMKRILAN